MSTPQTFEEWWATLSIWTLSHGNVDVLAAQRQVSERAFEAGVASQQAEIERYKMVVEAARRYVMHDYSDADVRYAGDILYDELVRQVAALEDK